MTLSVAVLEDFTGGRLDQQEPETARLLAGALAEARRYCGWHVTPVQSSTVKRNGGGLLLLRLPTLNLVSLTSVIEDGVALDVDSIVEDAEAPGHLYKRSSSYPLGYSWWAPGMSNIEVTFSHGFAAAEDFESAVLSMADAAALRVGGQVRAVGPFQYEVADNERNVLDSYRLERSP